MSEQIFKKNLFYRLSAYLLILPFIPAVRPMLNYHETRDLIVFTSGLILTIFFIIFSNYKPYIKGTDKNILIFLTYRHKPEIHDFKDIERITVKTPKKIILYTKGFDPLEIRLNKKEQLKFIDLIDENEIPINKADHS
ncbi:MAG: hypothetical protein PF518_14635 [Spirochaetaceae bacterium]|jgi:hypothetical protein|nr:hypothetical protein [Spirochaetaceae bacterium]